MGRQHRVRDQLDVGVGQELVGREHQVLAAGPRRVE
jgi:hypothetical protein